MGQTLGVEAAFLWVMLAVLAVGVIVALIILFASESGYDRIGNGAFRSTARPAQGGPAPGSAAADAEARAEIRQLVEAKSARREARGQAPLNVEAEIDALTAGRATPAGAPTPPCAKRSASSSWPATSAAKDRESRRSTSRPRSTASCGNWGPALLRSSLCLFASPSYRQMR